MTLEQSHNLQSSRSNSPHKRTLVSNKITNRQGYSSSSSSSIIDERLTFHLDACARASKVRDRVSLLMHRCHNNSKETQLHALYGMGNTCINKKSMTTTTTTRTTTSVANFDKDRFQKLMTKRKSLARMQTNACSKSWKIKNVHHANDPMNWSLDQEHVASTLNSINIPQHKQSHTSSSSSYPNNGYNGNQNQPCDIQNRTKVTRDHHSVILGHNNAQPNCKLKLKDLAVRFNHVPTTCTSSLQTVKKANISPRQTLDISLDESLHCITIDGDDEKYCGQDGKNGHDEEEEDDDDLLTLRSNASYLDAMEYSEHANVSFSSAAMVSRYGEGNNCGKERISSKRSIKHLRSGDSNGVNYLTQLQTLIGIQENDDGNTNKKFQNVNIKSTCKILLGNGDTTTSKAIADPFANDIQDSLKNIDHDLASIVSSQITFDGNHDKDHQHPSQIKLGKGTNCSLLRLCLMVWFISLVVIYERSWSREIYLLSSWRRIVEQSVKEAIDLQMKHLENMVALRPQSKSLIVTINAVEAVFCNPPYRQEPVTVTPVAIDEFKTVMKYPNDTVAFDNLLHRHDVSKRRLVGEDNIPTGFVRTSDTCGIDSMFFRDMMFRLSSEEEYVGIKQIGIDSTLIHSDDVEDTNWQQENDALNVSTIIPFSESNSKISKGHFWSSRKYVPFLSHDFVPYAGIHDSTMTSNLSRSFSTEKKSSHRIFHGQPSFLDMHSYKPLEYLHGRHSLDDEDDVSILDMAIDFFRITIKAWKQKRQIRK